MTNTSHSWPHFRLVVFANVLLLTACGGNPTATTSSPTSGTASNQPVAGAACTAPGGHTADANVSDPGAPHGLYVLSGALPLSQSTIGPDIQKYLVNNPDVCGGSVFVNWSRVDNGPTANPRYNWSTVDDLIAPWAQAHKTVSIQLGGSGYSGTPGGVLAGVPTWLQSQLQLVTCGNEVTPVYWQSAYETSWQEFVTAFVGHYQNNANVTYVHVGLASGAQTLIVGAKDNAASCLAQWNTAGYQTQWPSYVTQMISFVAALHSPLQLNVSFNDYANYPTADGIAAADAVSGIGFGFSGLQASDVAEYSAQQPCGQSGANWCALYSQYAGKMPLFVQTLQASYPGTGVTNASPQILQQMQTTGPLQPLLTTALATHAQIFELYAQDWLLAFDPSYAGYDQYHAAYVQALSAAAQVVGTAGGAPPAA